jgi:hypothetical protein
MSRTMTTPAMNAPEQFIKPRVRPVDRRVQRRRDERAWRSEQFA